MEIIVNIPALDRLVNFLESHGGIAIPKVQEVEETSNKEKTQAEEIAEVVETEIVEAIQKATTKPQEATTEYTLEEVREILKGYDIKVVKAAFNTLGVAKLTNVDQKDYAKLVELVKEG